MIAVFRTFQNCYAHLSPDCVFRVHPQDLGGFGARIEEMARFASAFDAVAAGSGRLVMLAGEPGVGKTRLAQEATLALRNRSR